MPVPLDDLRTLLRECTAFVEGAKKGTAFFIDTDLLLTVAHVAGKQGDVVTVITYGEERRTAKVEQAVEVADGDLALLRLQPLKGAAASPAVSLGLAGDASSFLAMGYPKIQRPTELAPLSLPQQQPFEYTGGVVRPGKAAATLVRIDAPQEVDGGISGAPLLDTATGSVIGIMQYRRETDGKASGGAAIPVDQAIERLPIVRDRHDRPPIASRRWRELTGSLRRQVEGPDQIDTIELTVSGQPDEWTVVYGETQQCVTVADLAENTAEAVFGWVPQRRPHDTREVQLCGGLLAQALFPGVIANEVREAARSKAPVRVQLLFPNGFDRLWEVPWEYATLPGTTDFLAMKKPFEVARCIGDHDVGRPDPIPRKVTVLPVVPRVVGGDSLPDSDEPWKALEVTHLNDILKELQNIEPARPAQSLTELERARGDQIDVLHFIGFGRHRGGYSTLLLNDESQGQDWVGIEGFCEAVVNLQPRLVICELTLPPLGMGWRPPPVDWCLPALAEGVAAVVYTQFPVHPRRLRRFNEVLYRSLASGQRIEVAVREGRRALPNAFPEDPAAFGSFVLVTGRQGVGPLVQAPTREIKPTGEARTERYLPGQSAVPTQ